MAYERPRATVAFEEAATKMAVNAEAVRIVRVVFEPEILGEWGRDFSGLAGGVLACTKMCRVRGRRP